MWIVGACTLLFGRGFEAMAQDAAPTSSASHMWTVVVDGRTEAADLRPTLTADSLATAASLVLERWHREGYLLAQIDSLRAAPDVTDRTYIYLHAGPAVRVANVTFEGSPALDLDALRPQLATRPGRRFEAATLEDDLAYLLRTFDAAGYPLASVQVSGFELTAADPPELRLTLRLDAGGTLNIGQVQLDGAERSQVGYVRRITGIRPGRSVATVDPQTITQRLMETGFYREVGAVQLAQQADGAALVTIPLVEEPPGIFDLVFGLLPAGEGGGVNFVGSGHLELRNMLGGGRIVGLKLDRLPGQRSELDVRARDPFVLGSPVLAEVSFRGTQEDSTFQQQHYGAEVGLRIGDGLEALASIQRERTTPGGTPGLSNVPRSSTQFVGLGMRYRKMDQPFNPRRGLSAEVRFERGRKSRTVSTLQDGQTVREQQSLRQERLTARVRSYVPTLRRQVGVLGLDGRALGSNVYDLSDLFRFGGAQTLRGYDEQRFLGRFVARGLAEYRYQLDRLSYAYAFFDIGYVVRPAFDEQPEQSGWYPGYGFGIQFSTGVGVVNASYAINTEEGPTSGRVHVGLSFGL
ncbi:MAG: BamA/TamA family outer membrane protein [Rhodothermales bacterium]